MGQFCITIINVIEEVRLRRVKRVIGDPGEPEVVMSSEEKFRIETFYAIIDRIAIDLNNRIRALFRNCTVKKGV